MNDAKADRHRDSFLVLRAQSGDRSAFDELLQRCQGELFGYLTNLMGSSPDAQDALQVTFIQAFRKLRWLREPTLFRRWIYQIANRIAYRMMRQKSKLNEISNLESLDWLESQQQMEPPNADLLESLPDWLARLTPKCRQVVALHYLHGFSVPQTAEILDIPLGTAKSRIGYALACLRKAVGSENPEENSRKV